MTECVNATSPSLRLCLHYELVFHHKWVDAQFFMVDAQFFGPDAQFFRARCTPFCCGTALTYKLCILLLLDYFHPRNDGFVSCLPFTEHVQTLFTLNWACANSVLGMCRNNLHNLPWKIVLIDKMTQTFQVDHNSDFPVIFLRMTWGENLNLFREGNTLTSSTDLKTQLTPSNKQIDSNKQSKKETTWRWSGF